LNELQEPDLDQFGMQRDFAPAGRGFERLGRACRSAVFVLVGRGDDIEVPGSLSGVLQIAHVHLRGFVRPHAAEETH